jgi:hypothetical protein
MSDMNPYVMYARTGRGVVQGQATMTENGVSTKRSSFNAQTMIDPPPKMDGMTVVSSGPSKKLGVGEAVATHPAASVGKVTV